MALSLTSVLSLLKTISLHQIKSERSESGAGFLGRSALVREFGTLTEYKRKMITSERLAQMFEYRRLEER